MVPTGYTENTPRCYRPQSYMLLIMFGGFFLLMAVMMLVMSTSIREGDGRLVGAAVGFMIPAGLMLGGGIYFCRKARQNVRLSLEDQRTQGPTVVGYNPAGGPVASAPQDYTPIAPAAADPYPYNAPANNPPPYDVATKS